MAKILDVNTDALVKYSAKLERTTRSAFPMAVRGALNDAAFQTKKVFLPQTAARTFVHRSPRFFSTHSTAVRAQGFNVNSMQSLAGITPKGTQAGEDLEAQEFGGKIGGRALIPFDEARTSKSKKKNVKKAFRVTEIHNVKKGGRYGKKRFIRATVLAGEGGYVLYQETLFRVDKINMKAKGRQKIKLTPLYSYKAARKVQVKATGFMTRSGMKAAKRMDRYYISNAEKQFRKAGL